MLSRNHPDRIQVTFDDRRLVANAGLLLPATLARHLGLPELVQQRLDLGDVPRGERTPADKLLTLVASALAGGDFINDADVVAYRQDSLAPSAAYGQGAIHPGNFPAQLPVGPRPSTRPGEPRVAGPGVGRLGRDPATGP